METQLTTKEKVHVRLKRQKRSMEWLAKELGITRPTLYNRLKNGFEYYEEARLKEMGLL